jgi:fructose-1,6-bisphosphatase/inositol monophosphatase family enzyme
MPLTDAQADALVAATRAVAADEIRPRFRNLGRGDIDAKRAFDDLVTVADLAAERALTRRIAAILPGDTVIGEEAVSADPALLDRVGEGRVTILDPIDGTWNFAHGIANYGVIVAVLEDGVTQWGLLYDPSFDDWIWAGRGAGAHYVRDSVVRRLRTDQAAAPFDRLRGNLGVSNALSEDRGKLASLAPAFRRDGSMGASLHEYRLLAQGASDFCLNAMLNVWDHAAGVLILEEAGGHSALLDGRPYAPTMRTGRLLNARSPALWEDVAAAVTKALAP